jgi:hypothetical protein
VGSAGGKADGNNDGVIMISEERSVTFVWRCSGCPAVYDCESLALLLDDGTSKACSCGGRLVEDVGLVPERELDAMARSRRFPAGLRRGF